jgi:acyl-coenzyme A synthetase/AMP-(fatty) acid ligase/thioesterase domain-containing protein/acyl carrier protein
MDEFLKRFAENVQRAPSALAVSDDTRRLTYAELDAASDRLAVSFIEAQRTSNDIIGFLGRMTAESVVFVVAAAKAGIAGVALDPSHPLANLKKVATHTGMHRVATTPEFAERAFSILGKRPLLVATDRPSSEAVPPPVKVTEDPDALFFVTFTSGSTGIPKGIPSTRRLADARWQQPIAMLGIRSTDRCAQFNTFRWPEQLYPLALGAQIHCFDFAQLGPHALDQWMREKRITVLTGYAALYRQLAAAAREPFPDLRLVCLSGEPARRHDLERFDELTCPGAAISSRYGAQEYGASIVMFTHRHGDPITFDLAPMGRCHVEGAVKLLNEDGTEVEEGEPGEVCITGPCVPAEYFKDPERTAAVYRREANGLNSCRLGDIAYRDHEGMYHYLGRKDQQIKIRGFNVRPPEIEQLLLEHPGVQAVAVSAFEGRHGIRRLACYFVPAVDAPPKDDDLRKFLSDRLPAFMVPGIYIRMDAIPTTATGKVIRGDLPNPMAASQGSAAAFAGTETERVLGAVWQDVLGHGDFGRDDDFFDVGGDSLQAMTMLIGIEEALQTRVPLEALVLDGATIAKLAARIDSRQARSDDTAVVVIKKGGERPPFFVTHVIGGHLSDYLALQQALNEQQPIYGLHPAGMDGRTVPHATMEEIATHCIASMRRQQSNGPYRLMGYSFGAYLAYEVACQLTDSGERVSHLVLLDPGTNWRDPLRHAKAVYRPLRYERNFAKARYRLTRTVPAALGLASPPGRVDEAHLVALMRYRPRPAAIPNVLLVSAAGNRKRSRNQKVWRSLLHQNVTIVEVNGDHPRLVREPNVWPLAQRIEAWLASASTTTVETAPGVAPLHGAPAIA